MTINFLWVFLFISKKQKMISRGRLEMEMNMLTSRRVKNILLLGVITYLLYTSVGSMCDTFLSFPFSIINSFFHFLPPRRTNWNAINSTGRNSRSGSPWIACSPTRSVNKCRVFYANGNAVIDFVIQLSCQVCIV